ncbi:hypothetical protein AN641_06110 [Candidatus Epulonipiscioides gigas]|nr:hypothetical protein AN641_06110 [Epulopiscium sp. SCG-C07WGA-EpuloA2]
MENNITGITKLCGIEQLDSLITLPALKPFDIKVCEFLGAVSDILIKDKECKKYPDIITFAFFCRKKNIEFIKKSYAEHIKLRLGQGLCFHIAPSNVPINFAYSLISAFLAGNASVVKVSSKEFAQTDLIIRALEKVSEQQEFKYLLDYLTIIKYNSENIEATKYLSKICDVRIIWGGDNTIKTIRQCALSPRAFDITFADRYSLAVFEASAILNLENYENFYNDTYLYDQNACTAPHLIYWLGDSETVALAKQNFWSEFHKYVISKYHLEPVLVIDKYMNICTTAIELNNISVAPTEDNFIIRINLSKLDKNIEKYHSLGGSFLEYSSNSLTDLIPIITKKYQTISYIGNIAPELSNILIENGVKGIDRIVPIGKTTDFSFTWDGTDLILGLSRIIAINN